MCVSYINIDVPPILFHVTCGFQRDATVTLFRHASSSTGDLVGRWNKLLAWTPYMNSVFVNLVTRCVPKIGSGGMKTKHQWLFFGWFNVWSGGKLNMVLNVITLLGTNISH